MLRPLVRRRCMDVAWMGCRGEPVVSSAGPTTLCMDAVQTEMKLVRMRSMVPLSKVVRTLWGRWALLIYLRKSNARATG